jgi:gluconolactonase
VYVCNNGGFAWNVQPDGSAVPHGIAPDYKTGSIQRVDLKTGAVKVLYDTCDGRKLRGPNDIVFDETGGFWFSDLGKSDGDSMQMGHVLYAKADGSKITRVREGMITPNGVGLSPDEKTLYVAETHTSRVWAFSIASPGRAISCSTASRWKPAAKCASRRW